MASLQERIAATPQGPPPGALSARIQQAPPEQMPSEDGGVLRFVDDIVRSVARGATFNFADEFAAFMREKTGGPPFETAVQQERARDIAFQEAQPALATGLEIAGAIASPISRLAPTPGAGLARQTLQAGGVGAGVGAVSAAGAAEGDIVERAAEAPTAALMGAVGGAAAVPALRIAGFGLQRLGRLITGKIGPKNEASRKILKALGDDNIDAQEALTRLKKLGPESGLADVGEENIRGLARAVASVPGAARTRAKEFLQERQIAQGERVIQKARESFGEFRKFSASADDLMEARAAAAAPKYRDAYQKQIQVTDDLLSILNTDAGKTAFRTAQRIASNEGRDLPLVLGEDLTIKTIPDMQSWDIIKRGFDSILNRQRNQLTGKLDLSDPATRSVDQVRRRLINELDRLNPTYKEARAVFAGPAGALDAMDRGRAFLKGDADVTAKILKDMTPADKDFFRLGVVRGIEDAVENVRDITDVTGRLFGSKTARDKLKTVFPGESFKQFQKFMEAEADMAITRQVVLGGSPTARIQAEQAGLSRSLGAVAEFFLGSPTGAAANVARQAAASLQNEIAPETLDRLGKLLFTKGGDLNEKAIGQLFKAEPIKGLSSDVQKKVIRALVVAAGFEGADTTTQEPR